MAHADDTAKGRRTTGRSPSYPSLDLEKAIARAGELYARDKQFPTPVVSAVRYWGYKGTSGPANLTVAALKKYGLIEDDGSKADRKIRVTDLAIRILNHPDDEARLLATQEAALRPPIHSEMWSQYGHNLPSDENLMWTLTRDQDFTESGARDFIKEYRRTIRFARLEASADVAPLAADQTSATWSAPQRDTTLEASGQWAPTNEATPGVRRYPIRLPNGDDIVVEGRFPLSEADWVYFFSILGHMKPAFTSRDG